MDLHLGQAQPTPEERLAVDAVLRDSGTPAAGAEMRSRRHLLLPVLHSIRNHIGWISAGALNYVSAGMDIAPAEVYGVASFYGLFSL